MSFTPEDYAELLGLYLGDGHISEYARAQRIRISLDSKYPGIVDGTVRLLGRVLPANAVRTQRFDGGATTVVDAYHQHLSCLLPQHGPGKKHERPLRFEAWQRELLARAPMPFVRGCINSDGCVFVNRTGPYEYLSYQFANRSDAILDLFAEVCEMIGLRPRRTVRQVRINRREDVAALLPHVPAKC